MPLVILSPLSFFRCWQRKNRYVRCGALLSSPFGLRNGHDEFNLPFGLMYFVARAGHRVQLGLN